MRCAEACRVRRAWPGSRHGARSACGSSMAGTTSGQPAHLSSRPGRRCPPRPRPRDCRRSRSRLRTASAPCRRPAVRSCPGPHPQCRWPGGRRSAGRRPAPGAPAVPALRWPGDELRLASELALGLPGELALGLAGELALELAGELGLRLAVELGAGLAVELGVRLAGELGLRLRAVLCAGRG